MGFGLQPVAEVTLGTVGLLELPGQLCEEHREMTSEQLRAL